MNDESIIILKAKEFREILQQELRANQQRESNITHDKLNREQAIKLAGMSAPTFRKFVKSGIFLEHGHGRKTWFFKSEITDALRNKADKKEG